MELGIYLAGSLSLYKSPTLHCFIHRLKSTCYVVIHMHTHREEFGREMTHPRKVERAVDPLFCGPRMRREGRREQFLLADQISRCRLSSHGVWGRREGEGGVGGRRGERGRKTQMRTSVVDILVRNLWFNRQLCMCMYSACIEHYQH